MPHYTQWRPSSIESSRPKTRKFTGSPHIEGSRVTVRDVHARVEKRGPAPDRVAERYTIDIADIYEALAYYHNNPEEMRRIEKRHERAAAEARERSSLTPPNN